MTAIRSLFVGVLCLLPLVTAQAGLSACVPGGGHDHYPFCNRSLSIEARVRDLISRIDDKVKPNLLTARGYDGTSSSRQALPELGVPSYYWGQNCIHSSMFSNCTEVRPRAVCFFTLPFNSSVDLTYFQHGGCSTSFPSGPSWAATFDRELMRKMAVVVGLETRAAFNLKWTDNGHHGLGLECWGPVLNMNRDPRWGRNAEGGTGECGSFWPALPAVVCACLRLIGGEPAGVGVGDFCLKPPLHRGFLSQA